MKVAVIGMGSAGQRHTRNLQALGCDVTGYDIDHQSIGDADAWVIATPWDMHYTYVYAAVHRGLPFYVEKPLGRVEDLPLWRELVEGPRPLPVHQVGYQLRFHPDAIRLKASAPTFGAFAVSCDMATWPGQSYGPLLLEMSHELDLALFCGAPATVTSVEGASIRLGDWLVSLAQSPVYSRSWTVYGQDTHVSASFQTPTALGDQMYVDAMAGFIASVCTGEPTACTLADGIRVLDVCSQVMALQEVPA